MLRIVELREGSELERIRLAWQDLARHCGHDTPYVLPEFLLPWMRRLEGRDDCRFLAAWQDDTLVGLAPVVDRRVRRFGVTLLKLRGFPEAAPTPPCDLLVRSGTGGVVEAFFARWKDDSAWDAIELPTVPAESSSVARLVELARAAGFEATCEAVLETYHLPILGTWQDYHATLSKKTRQNLRRGMRYFERAGSTRFASYPDDMTIVEARQLVAQVVFRSWKEHEQGAGGWNAFLRDVLEEFERSANLRLRFLLVDNSAVAYLMEVNFLGCVYAIHNAYDLRFQPGNAGQLMLCHALERAHREGFGRYDFTGNKDYLRRWSKATRTFRRTRIVRPAAAIRVKLRAYDWIHQRRAGNVLEGTDRDKERRMEALRDGGGRDE